MPKNRSSVACNYCRSKKIRCLGGDPCQNCLSHNEVCTFSARKRRQKNDTVVVPAAIAKKFSDIEGALQALQQSSLYSRGPGTSPPPRMPTAAHLSDRTIHMSSSMRPASSSDTPSREAFSEPTSSHPADSDTGSLATNVGLFMHVNANKNTFQDIERASVLPSITHELEYHGSHAHLSLCSRAGVDWINARVPGIDFKAVADGLTQDITLRLSLAKAFSLHRQAEPSMSDALRYSAAYFEAAPEAALGIICRHQFESKLQSFHTGDQQNDEVAWYALRNAIYASGCRIMVSQASGFRQAQEKSWAFFENALSVHTQIMYWQTTVVGVQALAVMAYFSESVSSPSLQYMLCSTAIRLAIAKGLHRRPSPAWKLRPEDETSRATIFWALYCMDKQIASRSGRPPVMCDDEITCQLPENLPATPLFDLTYLAITVKLCQLMSLCTTKLSNIQNYSQQPDKLVETVAQLQQKLVDLCRSCKTQFSCSLPLDPTTPPQSLTRLQALCVQFLYHTLILDIHGPLMNPWYRENLGLDHNPAYRRQIQASASEVYTVSKAAILDSQFIPIDASCPLLVAYCVPLFSVVNLFIHILITPNAEALDSALVLMEIGIGYFARLRSDTESYVSTPFVKELHQIACQMEKQARLLHDPDESLGPSTNHGTHHDVQAQASHAETVVYNDGHARDSDLYRSNMQWTETDIETDFETWSMMFMPMIVDGETANFDF